MNRLLILLAFASLALLAACSQGSEPGAAQQATLDAAVATLAAEAQQTAQFSPTPAPLPTATPTAGPSPTATPDTRPDPQRWSSWPVIPTVSARALEIYRAGLRNGNDPRLFSVIGDCQSELNVFMGIYATDRYYFTESDNFLQQTVDFYQPSFTHASAAVRDGLSAPSALSPLWADKTLCQPEENPVQCELRLSKPSIIFINMGTNWRPDAAASAYEAYLRQIVDLVIANGTLPILSTKADNIEGDYGLNLATARVAHDYDIPLWNFWLAAQALENGGLDPDREDVYLTPLAWDVRTYTALQSLDAITRSLHNQVDPFAP